MLPTAASCSFLCLSERKEPKRGHPGGNIPPFLILTPYEGILSGKSELVLPEIPLTTLNHQLGPFILRSKETVRNIFKGVIENR